MNSAGSNKSRANAGTVGPFRRGDIVVATRDLGKRTWCSGVPAGTVGEVVDVDWLGDLRVEFTLDGEWLSRTSTVEKVVAQCEVQLLRAAPRHMTGA